VALLLDTHALLWALTAPDLLSRAARDALEDRAQLLWVSAATAWKVATQHRLGKLPEADGLVSGLPRHIRRLGASELPVTVEHALLAGALRWEHRDPFDRMLAAQCMVESLVLVSGDTAMAGAAGVRVLW
jgi:PIN domain nuclease of toxin-antitoxin system